MNILVTGGAGFIGSHLAEELVRRGETVRVLDNLATGHLENLDAIKNDIEFLQGDIADENVAQNAARNMDIIFHQAALPSVPRSIKNPRASHDANLTGTLNVLIAARDNHIQRVVLASSSSVYGNSAQLPKVETFEPAPLSPYAVTKLACEQYARVFANLYDLSTICLRYFNVFGPRQDPTSQYSGALAKFVQCARHHEPFPVYGDGEQSRDFTYIENVVNANVRAAYSEFDGGAVVNVAGGARTTLNQILSLLNELTHQNLPTHFAPPRAGDVLHSHADISRARALLGYEPTVDVKEGLRRTLEWYQTH